jgi:hypothetical protein
VALVGKIPDGLVLRCVDNQESNDLMTDFHKGLCGGHHASQTTMHKILRVGYYWPMIFHDVHQFVRSCQQCHLFTRKQHLSSLPLHHVIVERPFQQWGLDFIGEFKDNSNNGFRWVLTTTDYFTRWVEVISTKRATDSVVKEFIEDKIITRFWCSIQNHHR